MGAAAGDHGGGGGDVGVVDSAVSGGRGALPTPPVRTAEGTAPNLAGASGVGIDGGRQPGAAAVVAAAMVGREGVKPPKVGMERSAMINIDRAGGVAGGEAGGDRAGEVKEGTSRVKGKSVEAKGSTGASPMPKRNRRELKVGRGEGRRGVAYPEHYSTTTILIFNFVSQCSPILKPVVTKMDEHPRIRNNEK